jgi:hypothetical protein
LVDLSHLAYRNIRDNGAQVREDVIGFAQFINVIG